MSLYHKYRPKDFSEIIGNEEIIENLETMLRSEDRSHSFLFTGDKGCGKTTLGRILGEKLGTAETDFVEINSSQFRGIDTVREIIKQSSFLPLSGQSRTWLIDECFAKGTMITLVDGTKIPIQHIIKGMEVLNLKGSGKVQDTFVNKVPLERIVKINLTSKHYIYCSCDHLFLTQKGWMKAIDLSDNFVFFPIYSKFVNNINSLNYEKNNKILRTLWKTIDKKTKTILQQFLSINNISKKSNNRNKELSNLSENISNKTISQKYNMFQKMWKYFSWTKKKRNDIFGRKEIENIRETQIIFTNKKGIITKGTKQTKNEKRKSFIQSIKFRKSERNKTHKTNTSYLERKTWWKWNVYKIPTFISKYIRMGNGISDKNESFSFRWKWVSNMLQSGYCKYQIKNSNRSRWEGSQFEKQQIERFEKNGQIERIRVESIEIYQPGYNDKSFECIISDTERNQKYVNFYDLQIEGHPSYIADNIIVHNCHKLTNDAQNAFLKILEEPPSHVNFILCTTDPQRLIEPLKDRCTTFAVKPLNDKQMFKLLKRIARKEEQVLDEKILDKITEVSKGHPRAALQILDKVFSVPEKKRLKVVEKADYDESQAIELCRAFMRNAGWKEISIILTGLKDEDPEGIRRMILGYFQSVLLKSENDQAAAVLEVFSENFYNTGFAGLVLACYTLIKGE